MKAMRVIASSKKAFGGSVRFLSAPAAVVGPPGGGGRQIGSSNYENDSVIHFIDDDAAEVFV